MEGITQLLSQAVLGRVCLSLVARKPSGLSRVGRPHPRGKDQGGQCDPWEDVRSTDVTEVECTFKIATWQRKAVDKQAHALSLQGHLLAVHCVTSLNI